MSYPALPFEPNSAEVSNLLYDIASRKEYYIFKPAEEREYYDVRGFITPTSMNKYLTAPGLQLSSAQLFIRNFQNPNTEFSRILINWQTGVGKSIAAISIGNEFIRQYRIRALLGEDLATVFIISFTVKETIKEDMLKYPEFGFVSKSEVEELARMRQEVIIQGSTEAKMLSNMYSALGRRITDKTRGGNYQFYGYKEFANRLFIITQKGVKEKFDVQSLFMPSKNTEDETFTEIINSAIVGGYVIINEDLLNSLKNGLIIADEIHNVYNILEKNNYGIAIQYVLNILEENAPRAVFMSATPMTGSASEIVDLLNLLVPKSYMKKELKRSDFFYKTTKHIDFKTYKIIEFEESNVANDEVSVINDNELKKQYLKLSAELNSDIIESSIDNTFLVSELKPNAREQISQLSAGRVSFLLDTDVNLYPKKIFIGDTYDYIPYLKITKCPMSKLHEDTIAFEHLNGSSIVKKLNSSGFAPNAYSLYDFVFPNPDDPNIGLYKSIETPLKLQNAKEKWKSEHGIIIENGSNLGLLTNSLIVSGPLLHKKNISKYSAKYAALLNSVLAAVKNGPGKIMIYHHRVKMTGVLLLAEILKMNGFIDSNSDVIMDNTLCAVCGIEKKDHKNIENKNIENKNIENKNIENKNIENKNIENKNHEFIPAKFIVAHSDIDRVSMMKNIHQFNSTANLEGYQYRIILGSKIIREGLNFLAVRYQFISSFPTDYPTLLQVIGRVVRKSSHLSLPEGQRDVKIEIFVSSREDDNPSPEIQRYINKGKEYLIIQEVEKSLRVNAVDSFTNYSKIKEMLPHSQNGEILPSLESIPYKPISIKEIDPEKLKLSTFNAYGHSEREVYVITFILRILFNNRPVWTYLDLLKAVKDGQVKGINYNHKLFDEGNFAVALHLLSRPSGSPPKIVTEIGKYFIQSEIKQNKDPIIDLDFYLRPSIGEARSNIIKISSYLSKYTTDTNFNIYLKIYRDKYLNNTTPIELSLIDFNSIFHMAFIKYLITNDSKIYSQLSEKEIKLIIDLYKKFNIIFTSKDFPTLKKNNFSMGYKDKDSLYLYLDTKQWKTISYTDANLYTNYKENNIIIGFVTDDKGIYTKFKTRPPLYKITVNIDKKNDIRSLVKGAICSTRFKEDLFVQIQDLKAHIKKIEKNITMKSNAMMKYMATNNEKKFPSTSVLCNTLKTQLLLLEEYARKNNTGVKWLYLFDEKLPNIQATA
uniref:Helicase C-terminal domain-containing protein n=1 Tax=viral metagenome TaxID=1070528 RepID=A0A6C0I0K3_9ZZZZ